METTDVREHFLLAAERRGWPYRKLAWRCDVWIDSAGDCVCLRVCRRGHYQPKQYVCQKPDSDRRNQRQTFIPFSITLPTICWDRKWLATQTETSQIIPAGEKAQLLHWKWAVENLFWEESAIMSYLCSWGLLLVNKKITDLPTHQLIHIFIQALPFLPKV